MSPVPAVARALDILDLFLDGSPTLSAPGIVARLSLPRTTVHELVQTLVEGGYLARTAGSPVRYALGLRVFELGGAYAANLDLAREGLEVARTVAAACEETVQVAILDGTSVVYIAKVDSTHAVRMVSAVGRRLPAHLTGLGKMLLSGLSEEELERRYAGLAKLEVMTPTSIGSMERLRQELAETRARGYAFDNCESSAGVQCVAAPVYDHTGSMIAAISIAIPIIRASAERWLELTDLVRSAAIALSRHLGHRSSPSSTSAVQRGVAASPSGQ